MSLIVMPARLSHRGSSGKFLSRNLCLSVPLSLRLDLGMADRKSNSKHIKHPGPIHAKAADIRPRALSRFASAMR